MRIQCKSCGKEYRVDEKRLTPEGVRVKCRTCGAILVIRLRQEEKAALDSREETTSAPPSEERPQAVSPAESSETPVPTMEPEPPSSPYRFCVDCGGRLGSVIPTGERPVCVACKRREQAGAPFSPVESPQKIPRSSSLKRYLLLALILVVLLLAAFLGYRFARGRILTFESALLSRRSAGPSLALIPSGYEDSCISVEYVKCQDLTDIH